MGILDKVAFWRRSDEPDPLRQDASSYDLGAQHLDAMQPPDPLAPHDPLAAQQQGDAFGNEAFQQPPSQAYPQYPQGAPFPGSLASRAGAQQYPDPSMQGGQGMPGVPGVQPRDVELILAKLDAIKSELDALHQRVRKIEETTAPADQQKRYW